MHVEKHCRCNLHGLQRKRPTLPEHKEKGHEKTHRRRLGGRGRVALHVREIARSCEQRASIRGVLVSGFSGMADEWWLEIFHSLPFQR